MLSLFLYKVRNQLDKKNFHLEVLIHLRTKLQLYWVYSIGETIRCVLVVGLIAGRTKADRDYTWILIVAILVFYVFILYVAEGGMGSFMVEVMANLYTKNTTNKIRTGV